MADGLKYQALRGMYYQCEMVQTPELLFDLKKSINLKLQP